MSTKRLRKRKPLAYGPNGRLCCRFCGTETKPPRRTFCSDACVHEHRLRSDVSYMREQVQKRDKGICALCGTDTLALWNALSRLSPEARHKRLAELSLTSRWPGSLWDADHILAVIEGGGETGLSNIRTLCIPCHKKVTREMMARRRATTK